MNEKTEQSNEEIEQRGNYVFVGFMFIGMGIGYLINNFIVGMFIGMGVGFLARVLLSYK